MNEYLFYDRYSFTGRYRFGLNVGCNEGLSTLQLARYCDTVVSFEPNKAVFELAKENLEPLGFKVHNVGLSNQTEQRAADLLSIHGGNATVDELGNLATFMPGDVFGFKPDLIKIDAYFDAGRVLEGLSNTITENKPDIYLATYLPLEQESWIPVAARLNYTIAAKQQHSVKLIPNAPRDS